MPAHLIVEEGPDRGRFISLEEGVEWVIGRDPDTCDFVIEDSTVSRRHARISKTSTGIYLKNLSRVNPCRINDEEQKKATLLKEGDRIQIGNSIFLFSEEAIPHMEESLPPEDKKVGEEETSHSGYDDIFGSLDEEEVEAPPLKSDSEEKTLEEDEEEEEDSHTDFEDEESISDDDEEREVEEEEMEPEELPMPPPPLKPEVTAYDTIFEDASDEEDLPFHFASEAPLMLKVIAGPNAGAEIGIERGKSYILGKDPNTADIVFQDISVSRNHARLTVQEDGTIEIEDLDSKNGTAVNGQLLKEKMVVTSQDLTALGTTVFMIIDRESVQETIYSPMETKTEPSEKIEESFEEVEEKTERDWKKQPIPMKYLVLAGSSAAVFLIVFLTFFSLFKSDGIEVAHKEPTKEIKKALAKFSDVQFSFNPASGKLFLVGHVLTPIDFQEMQYRLKEIDSITSIEDNVVIDEGVWKTMNDLLFANPNWRGVSIHSPEAGKFVVNGYIDTTEDAMKLYEYLTVNFPYLDRLENKMVIEQNLNEELAALIRGENLGTITFKLTNGNVAFSGQYSEKMQSEVDQLMKKVHEMKGITGVQNYATAIHPSKVGIDLSSQYSVTGSSTYDGRGFSVVMNGKIYTLGDLVDGMQITSIEPSVIILEKDGLKYKIDYTR